MDMNCLNRKGCFFVLQAACAFRLGMSLNHSHICPILHLYMIYAMSEARSLFHFFSTAMAITESPCCIATSTQMDETQRFIAARAQMARMVSAAIERNFGDWPFDGKFTSFRWGKNNELYHYNEFVEFYESNTNSAWHDAEPLIESDGSFRIPFFLR